jgi:hypothetical protein
MYTENQQQHRREQERNSPSPGIELLGAHRERHARMTISERKKPSVAVVWIQLV